jgi:hypothetical protein
VDELRKALADVERRVRDGEDEIARQRKMIQLAADALQETAPGEARLEAFVREHAARVAQRDHLRRDLALWVAHLQRSMCDD